MSLFLFLLVSGVGCDLCLWLFLDFSVYLFVIRRLNSVPVDWGRLAHSWLFSCHVAWAVLHKKWKSVALTTAAHILNQSYNATRKWLDFGRNIWAGPSEFVTYRLCEQRRFGRACASAQSRQNLRCSLIQAVSQEEPSDRKPDLWSLWMAGHAQLKFVMTECSKTQIRLTGPIWCRTIVVRYIAQPLTRTFGARWATSLQHGCLSSNLIDQNGFLRPRRLPRG